MTEVMERTETLLPGPAQALGALLGAGVPDLERGAGLPLLLHLVVRAPRAGDAGASWLP